MSVGVTNVALMKKLRYAALAPILVGAFALSGCGEVAPYDQRMQFLDEMSAKGIEYRGQLHQQGTEPVEASCSTGWTLLQASVPPDAIANGGGAYATDEWKAQAKEAYVKACLTGQPRPKPDPEGVKAVTPVPHTSTPPSPSVSPTAS